MTPNTLETNHSAGIVWDASPPLFCSSWLSGILYSFDLPSDC